MNINNESPGTVSGNESPAYKVVETNEGVEDGQYKCPKCGATCIELDAGVGALRCSFCRYEFNTERAVGLDTDISRLEGTIVGSGTQSIATDAESIITLKCASCGAEVVIDTNESAQARCHWCRNTLSINQQIPNGAVPDMVLPFRVIKEDARAEIHKFVNKRRFYAHPTFKQEFCTENIMGVYLPYMVVGKNTHAAFEGQGERLVREYTIDDTRYYDADLYNVAREFDLVIEGLTIISSADKLDRSSGRTNNIVNAIKPFDNENSVRWNANYLKGFASEKRDTNIEDLKHSVDIKAKDIARHAANKTLTGYDRGVRWYKENLSVKGQQWKSAYLPIWLYSYQQVKSGGRNLLHYVAVNARTKKTMGSVPVNKLRLFAVSSIIQILSTIAALLSLGFIDEGGEYGLILLAAGVLYYLYVYGKYRNTGARFKHEEDTKTVMDNIKGSDVFVKRLKMLDSPKIAGVNNENVYYDVTKNRNPTRNVW